MVSSCAQGENDLACFQFFYLDGQDFVNVVYKCLLKDLPRLRPEFEKSLATLKIVAADSAFERGETTPIRTGAELP